MSSIHKRGLAGLVIGLWMAIVGTSVNLGTSEGFPFDLLAAVSKRLAPIWAA